MISPFCVVHIRDNQHIVHIKIENVFESVQGLFCFYVQYHWQLVVKNAGVCVLVP